MSFLLEAKQIKEELSQLRRDFHQYPELSFQEYETAKKIVTYLQKIDGMNVQFGKEETGLPTGVVGTMTTGSGPCIAIRVDMDALPIEEKNEVAYRSMYGGKMHACGHDAHTTIGLGAAQLIAKGFQNNELTGTVKFIFQPAEEDIDEHGLTGAPYMVEAGVLDDVDAVIALHVNPERPIGNVQVNQGFSMASIDTFEGIIKGTGGHAAYPHLGSDPIWMLGSLIQGVQGIVSRQTSPLEPAVISITHVSTSPSFNIIPDEVKLQGTIRSFHPITRKTLHQSLQQTFKIIETFGGNYALTIHEGEPVLNNDATVTNWIERTVKRTLPHFKLHYGPFGLGGEDFAYMLEKRPGAMFFIGAKLDDNENRGLHMPHFDIDEEVLIYGTTIFTDIVKNYLTGTYLLR